MIYSSTSCPIFFGANSIFTRFSIILKYTDLIKFVIIFFYKNHFSAFIIIAINIFPIRIHEIHRIPSAVGIRTDAVVFLREGVGDEPAAEGRAVLAGAEVGVREAEVGGLVLLAREAVAQGDAFGDGDRAG